jgi:phage FluMu gp28-like protein
MNRLAPPQTRRRWDPHEEQLWWADLAEQYLHHPAYFVTDTCFTEDPTHVQNPRNPEGPLIESNPIRLIPQEDYLTHYLIPKYLSDRRVLLVPKSRRMIVTWTACALDLHIALWTPSAQVYIASKDQTDSDKLVHRCKFLYDKLPVSLPKPLMHPRMGKGGHATRLDFAETGSSITALNEDPNALRQEGATLLHIEEFGFWQWQEQSYTAMLPTTMGGGKVRIICSAIAGTFWEQLVNDKTVSRVRE